MIPVDSIGRGIQHTEWQPSRMMGGPLTGASLNPARSLGPAILSGQTADLWLYMVAPPVGGVLAALVYKGLLKERD